MSSTKIVPNTQKVKKRQEGVQAQNSEAYTRVNTFKSQLQKTYTRFILQFKDARGAPWRTIEIKNDNNMKKVNEAKHRLPLASTQTGRNRNEPTGAGNNPRERDGHKACHQHQRQEQPRREIQRTRKSHIAKYIMSRRGKSCHSCNPTCYDSLYYNQGCSCQLSTVVLDRIA